jgi:hypothetical protein
VAPAIEAAHEEDLEVKGRDQIMIDRESHLSNVRVVAKSVTSHTCAA